MLIGKPGEAKSALCTADADRITIRGRDLAQDLMGRQTFTEFFFFLMTGREATAQQRFFLDLLLVAIAEHGLTPTAIAARMTYDADPASLQGALAAGILGCGTVILGTAQLCGDVLVEAAQRVAAGEDADAVAHAMAAGTRAAADGCPASAIPLHRPVDPRTERIFALADARGRLRPACRPCPPLQAGGADAAWGKPLVMNVSMPIAAVLLDLDFPATMIKAIPLLARTGGLLAHLAEEQARPIGFLMASHAEEAIAYDGGEAA